MVGKVTDKPIKRSTQIDYRGGEGMPQKLNYGGWGEPSSRDLYDIV